MGAVKCCEKGAQSNLQYCKNAGLNTDLRTMKKGVTWIENQGENLHKQLTIFVSFGKKVKTNFKCLWN